MEINNSFHSKDTNFFLARLVPSFVFYSYFIEAAHLVLGAGYDALLLFLNEGEHANHVFLPWKKYFLKENFE